MKREVAVSDLQRLYGAGDMVKADCGGCHGCWECCSGMGTSVVLDPMDIYQLEKHLGVSFGELLNKNIEMNVVDGMILPNLKMAGEEEVCTFLTPEGRCAVHSFRPGICRLFPLGRYYEGEAFRYFLQSGECPRKNRTKVKVSKWLGIPELGRYEEYIRTWHFFLEEAQELVKTQGDEQLARDLNVYIINSFFAEGYDFQRDFYPQFEERMGKMQKLMKILCRKK